MKPSTLKVLSDEEIHQIHETSLNILYETGVVIQNEDVLARLKKEGAILIRDKQLARIPGSLIEEALRSVPKRSQVTLYDRERNPIVKCGSGKLHGASGNDANYILDSETGERRPALKNDVANFARLADALENIQVISPEAVPHDVTPGAAMVNAVEAILNNSTKHILVAVPNGMEAKGIIEISKLAIDGRELADCPPVSFMVSPTSPLRWEAAALEVLVEGSKNAIMHDILSEPISGITAPITLAGYLVIQNSEFLVGLLVSQLVNEGTPIMYGCSPTTMDMKEAWPLIGSPEAMILRIASGQLAKFYDLPSRTNSEADSQCMDEQNCWERLLQAVAAACSDMDLVITQGQFGTGMTVSYEQLLMDNEMLGILNRIKRGVDVNSDTLATEIIKKVGPAGQFIKEAHTHKHLKSEHLTSLISTRSSYGRWREKGGLDIVQVAKGRAKEILSKHKPKELNERTRSRIRDIVTKYEKLASEGQ